VLLSDRSMIGSLNIKFVYVCGALIEVF